MSRPLLDCEREAIFKWMADAQERGKAIAAIHNTRINEILSDAEIRHLRNQEHLWIIDDVFLIEFDPSSD